MLSALCAAASLLLVVVRAGRWKNKSRLSVMDSAVQFAHMATLWRFTHRQEFSESHTSDTQSGSGIVHRVAAALWLVVGQILPVVLLWLAWQKTFVVIPFATPAYRVGMVPVWWALAAMVLAYFARFVQTLLCKGSWLSLLLHPMVMLGAVL